MTTVGSRPNILLVVSDQERSRGWIPDELHERLPNRSRLLAEGMELRSHYTHTSPCSPSRATLLTGQYVPEHGVTANVFVEPGHPDLHTGTPTVGHLLREAGYRTSYLGKWHLSYGNPDMEAYGFSDWTGEDWEWTGLAGTGTYFDRVIADQAVDWLDRNGSSPDPWFLTVGLVNPHDICWYPADQPWYQDANPDRTEAFRQFIPAPIPGEPPITAFRDSYEELFDLPANFGDDLTTKPAVQRQWRWEENHSWFGWIDEDDEAVWRRALDYYFHLHERSDVQLGRILDALDRTGRAEDTVVIYTADHGEQCGAHGIRGKGPFAYEEIMHVPLYVRAPGLTRPGSATDSLTSSADVPSLICSLAGLGDPETTSGVDLKPLLTGAADSVRDHVLFCQEQAWHRSCIPMNYALRGYFDGRHKYVRYYGTGGAVDNVGIGLPGMAEMSVPPDAPFSDHEHELYDLVEDPGELVNLALDPGHAQEVREHFDHLLELEATAYTHTRPAGRGAGSTHAASMMDEAGWTSDGESLGQWPTS